MVAKLGRTQSVALCQCSALPCVHTGSSRWAEGERAIVNEQTVFTCAELPEGDRDWVWHADLNVVELRKGMTLEQRLAALSELQSEWRREHLHVVRSA